MHDSIKFSPQSTQSVTNDFVEGTKIIHIPFFFLKIDACNSHFSSKNVLYSDIQQAILLDLKSDIEKTVLKTS